MQLAFAQISVLTNIIYNDSVDYHRLRKMPAIVEGGGGGGVTNYTI